MLSLLQLHCFCKQVPERFINGLVGRHLTQFASSLSSCNGNDTKTNQPNNPSVSSYYKVNNQSAIDTAAGKVGFQRFMA